MDRSSFLIQASVWLALAMPLCFAQAKQSYYGRFDLYAVDGAFNLGKAKTGGLASVGNTPWAGAGKEYTGLQIQKKLGKEWEELWVEFVPEGDGFVDIDLQGEWYSMERAEDIRLIWVDNVKVEGATIANGDFEQAAPEGQPVGWRFTGPFSTNRYSRDGSVAQSGRSCIAVWIGSQAHQRFAVERGKKYRVRAWFRVWDPSAIKAPSYVPLEFPFEQYRQDLQIAFRTETAAKKAAVRMTPLYNDYEWAISSRWDDNNADDLKMRDVLSKHGHKGTFYLNSLWPDWSQATTTTNSQFGRDLLKGGHSIGSHSLTHPFLSCCSRNRIFEEVAGDRMVWEAATDVPVVSYAFSYCNFTNPQEGDVVHADIARALERGGFYNIANEPSFEDVRTDMILSPIMPSDGADIDGFVETALSDQSYRERHPNLTYSMHAWYRTPEAWARFEGQLDKYGHIPDWWYCNQNEYAAYRYQYLHTRLGAPVRRGKILRLRLERPVLLDLNDTIPLTFRIEGVSRQDVLAVKCTTANCVPADRPTDRFLFHLHHNHDQSLPGKIGMVVPNTENRTTLTDKDTDADFPGLKALLFYHEGQLRLVLDNQAKEAVTRVRVTYRLPLAWKEGVVRRKVKDVAAGGRGEDRFAPTLANKDYKFDSGNRFFLAQIDFMRGGEPGRLYATCYAKNTNIDHSYPQGGFVRLGPLSQNQFDPGRLSEDVKSGKVSTQPWVLSDDTRLAWQADDGAFTPPYMDVELVRVSGIWWNQGPDVCMLQTVLHSDQEQPVELSYLRGVFQKVLLNGEDASDKAVVQLHAGENRLFLVCNVCVGCFLRVVKPGTSERLTSIRFEAPKVAEAQAEPYTPPAGGKPRRKTLAGKWRGKLVHKLPPCPSILSPHPDNGISAEAKRLIAEDVDDSSWEELEVPKRWKDYGGDWPNVDGEAVFRRVVTIPAEWFGKDLRLSLGAIDDFDDTFFDGALVGRTDKETPDFYAAPRLYTIPSSLVKPGRNVLAVRIFDHFGDGGLTGDPLELFIAPKE